MNPHADLFYSIRQILLAHWDPIGVKDLRIGDNEYDYDIPEILALLERGAGSEEISAHLSKLTEGYGLRPNLEKNADAAAMLQKAYRQYKTALSSPPHQNLDVSNEELAFIAAKYAFAGFAIDEMQAFLNRLMNAGIYADAFYDVLYPDAAVSESVGPAFERSLQALNVSIPSPEDAVWVIIYYYMREIAAGEVDPYEGLKQFMYEVYWKYDFHAKAEHYLGDSHRVEMLIGLFWAYDDLFYRSDEVSLNGNYGDVAIAELKGMILSEAKQWISNFHFSLH